MKQNKNKVYNSIVFRIGVLVLLMSFIAIASMFSTVFISEQADKDAFAVNHAGSLRMQSYRMVADLQGELLNLSTSDAELSPLQASIKSFNNKLESQALLQPFSTNPNAIIVSQLDNIKFDWHNTIEPLLQNLAGKSNVSSIELVTLRSNMDQFVLKIDNLVYLYQQHAEQRVFLIRIIQTVSLLINVGLIVFVMYMLNSRIERPLAELIASARSILDGNYTAQTHIDQKDELGFLSKTMNKMADAIADSHIKLEKRVRQKTRQLETSNASLGLLYDISSLLSQPKVSFDLDPLVRKLSDISGIKDIDLCLVTEEGDAPYQHLISDDDASKDECIERDCNECISSNRSGELSLNQNHQMHVRYPLKKDERTFGVLVCTLEPNTQLGSWQHQLMRSFAAQIATGLHLRYQADHDRRYALVSERTVIARELHDSLAQSLSYLQFQVTRMQKMQQKKATQEQLDDVVVELKTGLSSAYRQLRELLTTFRLKIDADGLKQAFEGTIKQLNERANGKSTFKLDYRIGDIPLTPNEEIHLMQVAREATQNVLHHAQSEKTMVELFIDHENQINLVIADEGVGIGDNPEKLNHYGLAIMKERAVQLGGTLEMTPNKPKGTRVHLRFEPKTLVTGVQQSSLAS
jgi:two-component system, NarL family, nitrate/nitrite sensor histidine kinase NarX